MTKKTYFLVGLVIWFGLILTTEALAKKVVTVAGGEMERKVFLDMGRHELISTLGAPDRVKSEGRCFTYDVFGLTVFMDPQWLVKRIYLDRRFSGSISGEEGDAIRLDGVDVLEWVTVDSALKDKPVRLGSPKKELLEILGKPEKSSSQGRWLQYVNHDISFLLDDEMMVQQIYLGESFKGKVKGSTKSSAGVEQLAQMFGEPLETERLAYAPSTSIRNKATTELEDQVNIHPDADPIYPIEYRGHRKLYELYGSDMLMKYKYVLDEEGIAFYMDHNKQIYTTVLYPPLGAEPAMGLMGKGPAKSKARKKAEIVCLEMIHFDFDKSNIKSVYIPVLNKWIAYLKQNPEALVIIEGHTDAKGSNSYNQGLSERRSKRVHRYFTDRGIAASRLTIKGFSEGQPIAPNQTSSGRDDPSGRAVNRRVQFSVTLPAN
jgi:outer membrane protein OmpA-like peptidoglycan-associated protein